MRALELSDFDKLYEAIKFKEKKETMKCRICNREIGFAYRIGKRGSMAHHEPRDYDDRTELDDARNNNGKGADWRTYIPQPGTQRKLRQRLERQCAGQQNEAVDTAPVYVPGETDAATGCVGGVCGVSPDFNPRNETLREQAQREYLAANPSVPGGGQDFRNTPTEFLTPSRRAYGLEDLAEGSERRYESEHGAEFHPASSNLTETGEREDVNAAGQTIEQFKKEN